MATAKQITAMAKKVMLKGSVVISGVDYDTEGRIARLQVYFWDERQAVMDIISKEDIVENWPDEGVYVINVAGGELDCLSEARIVDGEEDFFVRAVPEDDLRDDLGNLPSVVILEALESICQLKEDKLK